jgi:ankyrin repeat protein
MTDEDGWTPLHFASHFGFPECVRVLLAHGARQEPQGCDGRTALHEAVLAGHASIVELLANFTSRHPAKWHHPYRGDGRLCGARFPRPTP